MIVPVSAKSIQQSVLNDCMHYQSCAHQGGKDLLACKESFIRQKYSIKTKRQSQQVEGRNFIVFSGLCEVCYLQCSSVQSSLSFTDWHTLQAECPSLVCPVRVHLFEDQRLAVAHWLSSQQLAEQWLNRVQAEYWCLCPGARQCWAVKPLKCEFTMN